MYGEEREKLIRTREKRNKIFKKVNVKGRKIEKQRYRKRM